MPPIAGHLRTLAQQAQVDVFEAALLKRVAGSPRPAVRATTATALPPDVFAEFQRASSSEPARRPAARGRGTRTRGRGRRRRRPALPLRRVGVRGPSPDQPANASSTTPGRKDERSCSTPAATGSSSPRRSHRARARRGRLARRAAGHWPPVPLGIARRTVSGPGTAALLLRQARVPQAYPRHAVRAGCSLLPHAHPVHHCAALLQQQALCHADQAAQPGATSPGWPGCKDTDRSHLHKLPAALHSYLDLQQAASIQQNSVEQNSVPAACHAGQVRWSRTTTPWPTSILESDRPRRDAAPRRAPPQTDWPEAGGQTTGRLRAGRADRPGQGGRWGPGRRLPLSAGGRGGAAPIGPRRRFGATLAVLAAVATLLAGADEHAAVGAGRSPARSRRMATRSGSSVIQVYLGPQDLTVQRHLRAWSQPPAAGGPVPVATASLTISGVLRKAISVHQPPWSRWKGCDGIEETVAIDASSSRIQVAAGRTCSSMCSRGGLALVERLGAGQACVAALNAERPDDPVGVRSTDGTWRFLERNGSSAPCRPAEVEVHEPTAVRWSPSPARRARCSQPAELGPTGQQLLLVAHGPSTVAASRLPSLDLSRRASSTSPTRQVSPDIYSEALYI